MSNVQEATKASIIRAIANFKAAPKERLTAAYLETRLESLEQHWQVFFKTHFQIISTVDQEVLHNCAYFKDHFYDEVEELYIDYKANLKEKLEIVKHTIDTSKGYLESSNVKLPEIKIPLFSGNYLDWPTFSELFLGLVHKNKLLDDTQKLYYLKGHLTGEAAELLKNISYNNKRFLVNNILNRLMGQKNSTSESAHDIKQLVGITSDCLESLKNLGLDTSSWDILIIHIISRKLDNDTRKCWELSISDSKLPTYNQFVQFLTARFRCLENFVDKAQTMRIPKTVQSYHLQTFNLNNVSKTSSNTTCKYCKCDHKITYCKKFSEKCNSTRRKFAQDNKLCFICLCKNHTAKACKTNFKCHVCKKRHHTLMHPSEKGRSVGENPSVDSESVVNTEGAAKSFLATTTFNKNDRNVERFPLKEGLRGCVDKDSRTKSEIKYKGVNILAKHTKVISKIQNVIR
ncbi:hypothetical protein ABMA28_004938 [Loxostege sticticalis]|uniref:Uncharacterized protein n=1 Tax=Loxostege sticticalis TaxID=481309 RepID=A0ABD0SR21_LOXSC